ncbi:MAG: hypothetical protein AAF531_13835 [Actinomycetota bacterium]
MPRKSIELDTPFRKGEKVVATRDLGPIPGGTEGKIQLQNGISTWKRYWVLFDGKQQRGQVDHDDLVRPHQMQAWLDRKAAAEEAALAAAEAAESDAASAVEAGAGGGGGGGGIADQIPAHLLERSRAAKARLLGTG